MRLTLLDFFLNAAISAHSDTIADKCKRERIFIGGLSASCLHLRAHSRYELPELRGFGGHKAKRPLLNKQGSGAGLGLAGAGLGKTVGQAP